MQTCMQTHRQVIFDHSQGKNLKMSEDAKVAESRNRDLDFLEMDLIMENLRKKLHLYTNIQVYR